MSRPITCRRLGPIQVAGTAALTGGTFVVSAGEPRRPTGRPNLLWIITDEWRLDTVGDKFIATKFLW